MPDIEFLNNEAIPDRIWFYNRGCGISNAFSYLLFGDTSVVLYTTRTCTESSYYWLKLHDYYHIFKLYIYLYVRMSTSMCLPTTV